MENPSNDSKPSDEEMRKLLKPAPSREQVLRILKDHYANDSSSTVKLVRQLDSYDDINYQVQIDGTDYLFKIHNGVESQDFTYVLEQAGGDFYKSGHMGSVIHLQNAMMELCKEDGIATSEPQKPKSNSKSSPVLVQSLPVVSAEHSPRPLAARLLSWVGGRPMSTIPLLPLEALADAGRFLGRLNHVLDHLNVNVLSGALEKVGSSAALQGSLSTSLDESLLVAARRYHQWDGKNTADLKSFVHYIQDEKRRSLVLSVLDAFQKEILDSGVANQFRKGVNHGDFNDANILLDKDLHVSGVIDFGDSVESWRVIDVAVAMAYAMLSSYGKANRSISAAAGVLRGFNCVYALTELERKHLILLMACRLACSVTLGAYSYQQNPENEYLLFHAEPAWKSLELIWCYDEDNRKNVAQAINRVFDQACLYNDAREKIITCFDLVIPDPGVADLLQSVRVASPNPIEPPQKKQKKLQEGKLPNITFVTGNAKKLEEVKRILMPEQNGNSLEYNLTSMKIDLPELQGNPIDIARGKCLAAAAKIGSAVITEDTCLCFNALNGLPGPYIKWFLESCGHTGLNKIIEGYEDKTAYAQTIVAFCPGPGHDPVMFDGRTNGKIVMPRGKLDFGWDPVFEPDEGSGKTYAEMSGEEKDAISHRSRAFSQLREYFNKFRSDITLCSNCIDCWEERGSW